jgi:Skp family chaperone for outer membrane proteins
VICALCATTAGAQEFSREIGPLAPMAQSGGGINRSMISGRLGLPNSLVLTLESDRFFAESDFGRRAAEDLQARKAVLAAENNRILSELRAEEIDLAERRASIEPQSFSNLAEAFDVKAQNARATQRQKFREIERVEEKARTQFREISRPVLEQIMREVGAAVILEQGTVLLSASSIDVTDLAIARVNELSGEGNRQKAASGSGTMLDAGE